MGPFLSFFFNFWPQVGARALAALQQGVDPSGLNQQQFLVYPTVGGIPMIISTDPAQQALTKVGENLDYGLPKIQNVRIAITIHKLLMYMV